MLMLIYILIGAAVGITVWRLTRGTWVEGSLWSHVARAVFVSVVAGAAWPGTVMVALGYLHPTTRNLIDRWINWDWRKDND